MYITHIERQPIRRCGKSNLGAFRKIKDISRLGSDFLPSLVGDFKFTFENDFHFVVGIFVDERCPFLQAIESTRDGLIRVILITAGITTSCD